ncbi:homoserine dehydrogenase [Legionella gresilensis]|uniref:homoserine dehydrogenase n=1 Tax=Legionella gresilensis TaxID=91823 RepID=UPI001041A933|nr:homoserine dehydrogenase [Legionella gresilensis]
MLKLIVAVIGASGNVGGGVVNLLNKQEIPFLLKHAIVKTLNPPNPYKGIQLPKEKNFSNDIKAAITDPDVNLVVVTTGDLKIDYESIVLALSLGKHVVTPNKAVIAEYGDELLQLADLNNVCLRYDSSCMGGVPLIPIIHFLKATPITGFEAVLNGTSNYLLNKMSEMPYEQALKSAQEAGYAEPDPTADVKGHDVSRKAAIIMAIIFRISIKEAYNALKERTKGITELSPNMLHMAKTLGGAVRLVAQVEMKVVNTSEVTLSCAVEPTFTKTKLADLPGPSNGILITKQGIETCDFFSGAGAGREATASSVLNDITEIAEHGYSQNYWHCRDAKFINEEKAYLVCFSSRHRKILPSLNYEAQIQKEDHWWVIVKNAAYTDLINELHELPYEQIKIVPSDLNHTCQKLKALDERKPVERLGEGFFNKNRSTVNLQEPSLHKGWNPCSIL